jgi:hypothetical protein
MGKTLEKASIINESAHSTKSESVAVNTPRSLLLNITFQLPW